MSVALAEPGVEAQLSSCRRLARVLVMTRKMVECADAGDWERVALMERDRREDLNQCFSEAIPLADTDVVAEALAVLLHLNEELMSRLQVARSSVMEQGREFSQKRLASNSYQSVAAASQPA